MWCVGCMLIAHWTFFIAGTLGIRRDESQEARNGSELDSLYVRGNRAILGSGQGASGDARERVRASLNASHRRSSSEFNASIRLAGDFLVTASEELRKIHEEEEKSGLDEEHPAEEQMRLVSGEPEAQN